MPVYDGRFFLVPEAVVLEDIRRQVQAGATHITFGDPDFLNGPGHSMSIVRAMHAEFPRLTFDVTAKIEHLLKRRSLIPELARAGMPVRHLRSGVVQRPCAGDTPQGAYRG